MMTESPAYPAEAFSVAGPTDGMGIVFIHGAAATRALWRPQVEALAATFRVVTLDLPGHGALAAESFTLAAAVTVVGQAVALTAKGRALVVGLSLGGYVALAYAAQSPERCAGLVLSGCAIEYHGALGRLSQLDATLSLRIYRPARLVAMQSASYRSSYPPEIAEAQIAAGFTFEAMPAVYRELAQLQSRALLRKYPGPILILNGEQDGANRRGEARMLAAAQNARVQVITGAGHLCNLDQPAAFTAAVREFALGSDPPTSVSQTHEQTPPRPSV